MGLTDCAPTLPPEGGREEGLHGAAPRFQDDFDDRARLFWLPGAVGLPQGHRPFDVEVDPRTKPARSGEHPKRELEHLALHRPIAGPSKSVAERELYPDHPGCPALLSHRRHHRHHDRGDSRSFDPSCQHGHVRAAIGSSRGEDEPVRPLFHEAGSQLAGSLVPPARQAAFLVAHHRHVLRGRAADYPLFDQLIE